MVAKSFQNFIFLSEPFVENKRTYIMVKNPKTKTERKVRWYTEKEYAKLYPAAMPVYTDNLQHFKGLRQCLGFEKGFITIFRNVKAADEEFFRKSTARKHKFFGWYFISTDELPQLPSHLQPIVLNWELIGNEEGDALAADAESTIKSLIKGA
jgi:hypothetical protein